jgi:hypothetical protein
VTARKPFVPAALRDLLLLMDQIAAPLPIPAKDPAATGDTDPWAVREARKARRDGMLRASVIALAIEVDALTEHPSVAAELLAQYCERQSQRIREELAAPLGYEPRPQPEREAG